MFPPGFFFGAATSGYQVEGGNKNDWTKWPRGDAGKACDHYNRFEADFDLAMSLSHNAHRFSLEWSRIEPEEGKFDEAELAHYAQVFKALKSRGLEPFVTLWHFTLPLWFVESGGWLNRKSVSYFERYVKKVAETYHSAGVKFWVTVNEPDIYALNSYYRGKWPPGKTGIFRYWIVRRKLIKAHKAAYAVIKKNVPYAEIGIAKNNSYFEFSGFNLWNKILKSLANKFWNHYFLNQTKEQQDFIGLNYYFHSRVNWMLNRNENKSVSDIGWEIYPEGLYHVLMDLKRYGKPIYVTENGLADAEDKKREIFIKDHLEWASRAMKDGVRLRGYFHWSLLDNFEWDKGFAPRFGLVEVDYKTMKRKVRPSAKGYKKLIESSFRR